MTTTKTATRTQCPRCLAYCCNQIVGDDCPTCLNCDDTKRMYCPTCEGSGFNLDDSDCADCKTTGDTRCTEC